jgi:2,3-bisphosphoglycerate-independent phosphoglycerate mutase
MPSSSPNPRPVVPRPVVLCILDGWGHREACKDNAICQATTPWLDRAFASRPHALLQASELEVGLPTGQFGNSEVGHMNLGAGRVVMQELPRIDQAIASHALAKMPAFRGFVQKMQTSGGRVHLLGLLSPGGVHAHQDQIAGLAEALIAEGLQVRVHAFLDGRDTPPRSALGYLARFQAATSAPIVTVSGRFYAMDRDKRWERIERAYHCLVSATGERAPTAAAAVEAAYAAGLSDEFVLPTAIGDFAGMVDGDGLVMANFRADRARQILAALLDPAFAGFARGPLRRFSAVLGLVGYGQALAPFVRTLFEPGDLRETLGELVAKAGRTQLRIAETEKYAHVTFFLNGGSEQAFPGEERILVPSPRVATYDLKPEMSAEEVTDRLVEAIRSRRFDLIVVNYANADMVGHSGKLAAAIAAVEAVDRCLGRLEAATREAGGVMLITADHGNVEMMRDPETGESHTAHTTNPVPALLVNAPAGLALDGGRLADVAPTLLELMRLERPKAMTGRSLLRRAAGGGRTDLHARA